MFLERAHYYASKHFYYYEYYYEHGGLDVASSNVLCINCQHLLARFQIQLDALPPPAGLLDSLQLA